METYKELRERQRAEVDALPLGFAFSDAQFEEMKKRLGVKDNSELYALSGSAGGFFRKVDAELIHGTFIRHAKERKAAIFTPDGINAEYLEAAFYYEMCNHEFAINWEGEENVLAAVEITPEQMKKHPEILEAWNRAKRRYYADAEKNGWN